MNIVGKKNLKIGFKIPRKKYLTVGKNNTGGRNNSGRITAYHRGSGHKRLIRIVDYFRFIWNIYGIITYIEYDPNRNGLLAFVVYSNGLSSYIIATSLMKIGTRILAADHPAISDGNVLPLKNIPTGVKISNIEISRNCGAQYVRAAGTYSKIISKTNKYAIICLRSGVMKRVLLDCIATIGQVSNFNYMFKKFNKAGVLRHLGWRPVVRGVAMNPIDHPHGGGQGKTSGGRPSVTPWGLITKGYKTSSGKRNQHLIVKLKSKKPKQAKSKSKLK